MFDQRSFLVDMFHIAVAAVSAEKTLPAHLPAPPKGRTLVLGAGKAAASMAHVVEQHWKHKKTKDNFGGLVVTRYNHDLPLSLIDVVQSGHPMPDNNSELGARRMLQLASELTPDDLLLCLMSGGASALLSCPADGLSMTDMRAVNKALLNCGAPIDEMNCVRKHISAIAGGRLAAACRAPVVTLLISDVPGDDPSVIGSGPTVADPTTFADAIHILKKYNITPPENVARHLQAALQESLKPGDPRLEKNNVAVIATPQHALDAAATFAKSKGITPLILGHRIEGEARDVAKVMAGIALQVAEHQQPLPMPCVIISGGETTVTIKGQGRGGRNAEFLLALTNALQGNPHIAALACDTDGIDGTEDNAGAVMLPDYVQRAAKLGIKPANYLEDNDGYGFFEKLGGLITTGPTRTNVNDFRAILVMK
jgi:hydroxypyruvate reductase